MAFNLNDYEPVEERLRQFWGDHPEGRIETELLHHEDGDYIVFARVFRDTAAFDGEPYPTATGLAHDSKDQLPAQMKASALEVCETSAIGRALANMGYAPKNKRPSREEMQKASGRDERTTVPITAPVSGAGGGTPKDPKPATTQPDPTGGPGEGASEGDAAVRAEETGDGGLGGSPPVSKADCIHEHTSPLRPDGTEMPISKVRCLACNRAIPASEARL